MRDEVPSWVFPYLEQTIRELGGNIDGLLGLSSLGVRRLIFDHEASLIRIEP